MTKYVRQLKSAQELIKRKGVRVTWLKSDNTNTSNDPTPEFPTNDTPTAFKVWMVFYPAQRQNLETIIAMAVTGSYTNQNFAVLAGGLKFTPEKDDEILLPDGTVLHVDAINITQPDLTPIIYELTFR